MTSMTDCVGRIVASLDCNNPPVSLTAARDTLRELIVALRGSIEEMMADPQPNYSTIADRVTAIETIAASVSELDKAEVSATAALGRIWKKLHTERNQHRVWCKLRTSGEQNQ